MSTGTTKALARLRSPESGYRLSDVIECAQHELAAVGVHVGFKKLRRMYYSMQADERRAERIASYEGGMRDGREKLMSDDPVGEDAAEFVDWARGNNVFITSGRVRDLDSLAKMSS